MTSQRRHPKLDVPRLAAYNVLKAVRTDDAYANLVLPTTLAHYELTGRDAAFVTELVSGTLRMRGTYDAIIAVCSDRPLAKIDAKTLDILRLTAHQLLSMRVPDHGAINTAVELVKYLANSGAAGFANAVLRRITAHDLATWVEKVTAGSDHTRRLEIAHSHPVWIVDELAKVLPDDELEDHLASNNVAASVTLVAKPGRIDRSELPGAPTRYSEWGMTAPPGPPTQIPAVADGRAGVQDEGSQLVARALAMAPLEGHDEVWLDLCAGPGGKSAVLAGLAEQRGARLIATEIAHHRAKLVHRSVTTARPARELVCTADGTQPPLAPRSVDRVLLDAPCSGLGALRRRPEARWRRRPEDLVDLVRTQQGLIESAVGLLRPGGVLLYATCSPVLAETSEVVSGALDRCADVELADVTALFDPIEDCAGPLEGSVQLWPHRHHTDAMFVALLRRTG